MVQNGQNSRMKPKVMISAIAVAVVLCVAPIGSYLFLKGGFQYRLESLNQLVPKDIDPELQMLISEYAPFKGNARLIHVPGTSEKEELSVLDDIDDQIVDRERFDIYSFSANTFTHKHKVDFVKAPAFINQYQFVLIDTSNQVRGVYPFGEDIRKEIIRHLSVVLPMPRQKTITLKRDKQ